MRAESESPDTAPSEGSDPEDRTSGGSGGNQSTSTHEESGDFDRGGEGDPGVGEEDVVTDTGGEPVTKPDQASGTPGQMND
jgi:hypothetical protein